MDNETTPLFSIANDLTTLTTHTHKAADLLSRAAEASVEGRNDARDDLIRDARAALFAVLVDDVFTLAPEVSQ